MKICIAEDRESEEAPLMLLLQSLHTHCPDIPVTLYYPPADARFRSWLASRRSIELIPERPAGAYGWNVKPHALLAALETEDVAWWIDSDIVVLNDIRRCVEDLDEGAIVVTEEALFGKYHDDGLRTKAWGFELGRHFRFTLNSCVLRCTRAHLTLLTEWHGLLNSEVYRNAQNQLWNDRPNHMLGDQDVLTALLFSRRFSDIPIKVLRRGRDIIQYFGQYGYTPSERFRNLFVQKPTFVHSQGPKPWHDNLVAKQPDSISEFLRLLYLELSPHNYYGAKHRGEVDCASLWLDRRSKSARFFAALGFHIPELIGLPFALVYSLLYFARAIGKALFALPARVRTLLQGSRA